MILSAPAHPTCPVSALEPLETAAEPSSESSQLAAESTAVVCVKVADFNQVDWKRPVQSILAYAQIVNYPEAKEWQHNMCAMCGRLHSRSCFIPKQNKDICRECDCAIWMHQETGAVLKFCKGCKNFVQLAEFNDKPTAAKCGKCRERGRANYVAKKRVETDRVAVGTQSACTTTKEESDGAEQSSSDKLNPNSAAKLPAFNSSSVILSGASPTAATVAAGGTTTVPHFSHWNPKLPIDNRGVSAAAATTISTAVVVGHNGGSSGELATRALRPIHSSVVDPRVLLLSTHPAQNMSFQLHYLQACAQRAARPLGLQPAGTSNIVSIVSATSTPAGAQTQMNPLGSPACRPSPRTVAADFHFSQISFQSPPPSRPGVLAAFCTPLPDNSSAKKLTRQVSSDLVAADMAIQPEQPVDEEGAEDGENVRNKENKERAATFKRPLETHNHPLKKRLVQPVGDGETIAVVTQATVESTEQCKPLKDVNERDDNNASQEDDEEDAENDQNAANVAQQNQDHCWTESNPLMQLANLIDVLSR